MPDDLTAGYLLGFALSTFTVLVTAVIVGAMDGQTPAILAAAIGESYTTWDLVDRVLKDRRPR